MLFQRSHIAQVVILCLFFFVSLPVWATDLSVKYHSEHSQIPYRHNSSWHNNSIWNSGSKSMWNTRQRERSVDNSWFATTDVNRHQRNHHTRSYGLNDDYSIWTWDYDFSSYHRRPYHRHSHGWRDGFHCPSGFAPSITSKPKKIAAQGKRYEYQPVVVDRDQSDGFVFKLLHGYDIAGVMFDEVSGKLSWTPSASHRGFYKFKIAVTDRGGLRDKQAFWLKVVPGNQAPELSTLPPLETILGDHYNHSILFTDADGDTLSYALTEAPLGAVIDDQSGMIEWLPSESQLGPNDFIVQVSDQNELVFQQFTVIVKEQPNSLPVAENQTVSTSEDSAVSITLMGSDEETESLTFSIVSQPEHGAISGVAPNLTYLPNPNYFGNDAFSFIVNDGEADSLEAVVSISVASENDHPIANRQSIAAVEDIPVAITLTGSDVETENITYRIASPTENGTLTGTIPDLIYVPNANFAGSDRFTFTVNDGELTSEAVTVFIAVAAQNDQPVANAQNVSTNEDNNVAITLTGSDVENSDLTYAVATQPINGTLSGTAPNLTYAPNANFAGSDSFTFTVNDGELTSEAVTVSIAISAQNDQPVADAQNVSTNEDNNAAITLSGSDIENSDLTYVVVTQPTNGTLSGTGPNLTYAPNANFAGSDSFTFTVSDGELTSEAVSVAIEIVEQNDQPVANAQNVSTNEDSNVAITLTGSDIENNDLTYVVVAQPKNGTLSGSAPNLTYTPNVNFAGSDSFTFTVNDGELTSEAVTVNIEIAAQNDQPVANAQAVSTNEDNNVAITLIGSDIENSDLTYVVATQPTNGTLSGTAPNLTYTPNANFFGQDSFTFTVNDGELNSGAATVSITVVGENAVPVANAQTLSVNEDADLAITLTGSDDETTVLTYTVTTLPLNGILSGVAPDLTYTPNADFFGSDVFSFIVSDDEHSSELATVSIDVVSQNDRPVGNAQSLTTAEEQGINIVLTGFDTDGDSLTYAIKTPPQHGQLTGTAPNLTYTPNTDYHGADHFDFTVNDGQLDSFDAAVTIQITAVNDAPTITSSPNTEAFEGFAYQYQVEVDDVDSSDFNYALLGSPEGMTISATGAVQWTPAIGASGAYTVNIVVSDGDLTATQNFTLTVERKNQLPVFTSTPTAFVVQGNTWEYLPEVTDPDGDSVSFAVNNGPANLVVDPQTGAISWPTTDVEIGQYTFDLLVTDSFGETVTQAIVVDVLAQDSRASHEGTEFWVPVTINLGPFDEDATFDINLVSHAVDTEVTIAIPLLDIVETLSLTANEIATYTISLSAFNDVGGFLLNQTIENGAIHITSASPISAYFMNQQENTTDGFLGLPKSSLGKEYVGLTYNMLTQAGIVSTVDAGQLGSMLTIVATEDNTQVTIDPVMDIFPGEQAHIEVGTPIELILNAGDVYNLEAKGSFKADLTGTLINADKPINVLGQVECTYVPVGSPACDHLVEQLPPIEALGTEYFTAPFWGREVNGGIGGVEYGDRFRVVAPYDNTNVYLNGVLRAQLDQSEFYEFASDAGLHVTANQPVLLMQYANSDRFDDRFRTQLARDFADPFMVVVSPVEQYLTRYTINTPARDLEFNFVNVIIPTAAAPSMTLDGNVVDQSLFQAIADSAYSYAQVPITTGAHTLQAEQAFGAYVYGYDFFESYGYLGGMALNRAEKVASLTLSGDTSPTLDTPWCAQAQVADAFGRTISGVRVAFAVSGITPHTAYRFSDNDGMAEFCYHAFQTGTDTVTATLNHQSDSLEVEWLAGTQNQPPVITSLPVISTREDAPFSYQVHAHDPEGEALSYELVDAPNGMDINQTGAITWPQPSFAFHEFFRKSVVVKVIDPQGLEAVQRFALSLYEPFNTAPEFLSATPDTTAYVGVPYIYNLDEAQHNLGYLKHQVLVEDSDKDAAFVDILNGPEEAYIQRVHAFFTGIERPNEPRHHQGVIHYLRWSPANAGVQALELGLRDARGARTESRQFTVDVKPNLPPKVVDFNPPAVASTNTLYRYSLTIDNDVPSLPRDNLDNLQIVFEEAPIQMQGTTDFLNGEIGLFIQWFPQHAEENVTVRFHITDRVNRSDSYEFTLTVVDDNQPPELTGTLAHAEVSIPYQHQVIGHDPEGGSLRYFLLDGPDGMQIDSESGLLTWLPTEGPASPYNVWVWVGAEDEAGLITYDRELLHVTPFFNRAPVFTPAYRPINAKVGVEFTHLAEATDREGDEPILYEMSSSATGDNAPTINSETGLITWTPTQTGEFWLNVTATDSERRFNSSNSQFWRVNVLPDSAELDAELTFEPSNVVQMGDTATLTVNPINAASSVNVSLTVNGQAVAVDSNLQAQITPDSVGRTNIVATITDGHDTVIREVGLFIPDPADVTPPQVSIAAPLDGSIVTAPTDIIGTVLDDNLVATELLYKRADEPDTAYQAIYRGGESFDNQSVGTFDPTQLINGNYHILLQGTDSNGQIIGHRVAVIVEGDLKVGHFSFTVQDLNIPLAGIPIQVSRTYDTRRRHELLDFGHGWSIDYQNVRVEESREPTQGWTRFVQKADFPGAGGASFVGDAICSQPVGEKTVTVTLPNGQVEKFQVYAEPSDAAAQSISVPECFLSAGSRLHDLKFAAIDDTLSTLTANSATSLFLDDLDNGKLVLVAGDDQAANITQYTLTTQAGYVYQLDQTFGVRTITDPNGHTLTYSDSGIAHSSGKAVTFVRNSDGLIEQILDPAGNAIVYEYNVDNDLATATDRVGAKTFYWRYDDHRLLEIYDPLDRRTIRNTYDEDGRLTGQEDNQGNVTTFDHNIDGRETVVTDRDGRTQVLGYDDDGNVLTEIQVASGLVYSDSIRSDFTYDANDNELTRAVGGAEYTYTATFDDDNNQLSQTDPLGHVVTYENYNALGQEGRIVDERGHAHDLSYDSAGNLLTIEGPAFIDPNTGETRRYSASNVINNRGLVASTTDMRGHTTTYTYYPVDHEWADQKHTETTELGGTVTFTYDANNNVKTETRERTVTAMDGGNAGNAGAVVSDAEIVNETVTYDYDKQDRLIKTTYPDGSFTATEYDLAGNITRERDRFGNWTATEYDLYGRLVKTTYPDGTTETRTYTQEGLLDTVTDPRNVTMRYEYDDFGRQWQVHNTALGTFTETQYTPQGWVQYEWDENRNLTEYTYDEAGRRTSVIRHGEINGETVAYTHSFTYYANGELKSETDAQGHTTEYTLNALDQRTGMRYHNGTRMRSEYDAMGARIRAQDQNNRATRFDYDNLGRLKGVQPEVQVEVEGNPVDVPITGYTYDEVGNKLTQTDAKGNTTTYTYDYFGRLLTKTLPEGQSESFEYVDGQGCQPIAGASCSGASSPRTMVHTDFNGDTITMAYDVMGRLVSTAYSKEGTTEVYTYYEDGQTRTVTDPSGTIEYAYDSRDLLTREIKANGAQFDYTYDAVGNRTAVQITRHGTLETHHQFTFDDLNRLSSASDALNPAQITTYAYEPVGNLDKVAYWNGLTIDYDYNTINQLTDVFVRDQDNNVVLHFNYTLDATGRRTVMQDHTGKTTAYCYDALYRLTAETTFDNSQLIVDSCLTDAERSGASYKADYQYDLTGNRTFEVVDGVSTAYSYDKNDRLLQTGGTTFGYDNNGNTISEVLDSTTTSYIYDGRNRLTSMTKNGTTTEYTYNYLGTRTSKSENGVTTEYLVDENRDYAQTLQEVVNGELAVSYLHGHDLISQSQNGVTSLYHADGVGSTRALSNDTGAITDTWDYEAFGEILDRTGTTDNSYLYNGENYDSSQDRYNLRDRWYDHKINRFDQMDRWQGNNFDPVTLHKYLGMNADPANMIDPSGNFSIGSIASSINILGNLVSTAQTIHTVFNIATGDKQLTAKEIGSQILLSLLVKGAGNSVEKVKRLLPAKWRNKSDNFYCRFMSSFEAGTLVHTATGLTQIEDIKIGDFVWTYNESSGENEIKEVVHVIARTGQFDINSIKLSNKENLLATSNHPFFINGEWVNANLLILGDELKSIHGDGVYIEQSNELVKKTTVFNLSIMDNHNYLVSNSGILVHNTNKKCGNEAPEYDPRIRQRAVQDPVAHNFPFSFDVKILSSRPIRLNNNATGYAVRGYLNGRPGVYNMIVDKDKITHRDWVSEKKWAKRSKSFGYNRTLEELGDLR